MRAVNRRLCQLEHRLCPVQRDFLTNPREHIRVFISACCTVSDDAVDVTSEGFSPTWLAGATCQRTLTADGVLIDIVHDAGDRRRIPENEMRAFIARFPVERI